jgi:hypothetical protein
MRQNNDRQKRLRQRSINIKSKTMAILSNSWAQHLAGIAGNNDAKKNMSTFTEALALSKTTTKQQNTLVEEVDAAVFLVEPKNMVQRTHSLTKFGGMQSRPKITIACLVGSGPRAMPVTINENQAVALQTIAIPSTIEISACKSADNFVKLTTTTITSDNKATATTTPTAPTPARMIASGSGNKAPANATTMAPGANATAANPQGRTTHQSTGGARAVEATSNQEATPPNGGDAPEPATSTPMKRQGGHKAASRARATTAESRRMRNTRTAMTPLPTAALTTQNAKLTSTFIIAPFLCNAIFNKKSSDLVELIIFSSGCGH